MYKQRLGHIERESSVPHLAALPIALFPRPLTAELHSTIERLSILLGPPFEPPSPLMPIPGMAVPARAPRASLAPSHPPQSQLNLAPTINKRTSGRRASALPVPIEVQKPEVWLDVGEDVFNTLQAAVDAALAERDVRLRALETVFNDLIWYRAELDLPPLDGEDGSFPPELKPGRGDEEVPGAHVRYEALLEHVVGLNPVRVGDEEEEGQEIQGMEEVEPEVGLIAWADALLQLVSRREEGS